MGDGADDIIWPVGKPSNQGRLSRSCTKRDRLVELEYHTSGIPKLGRRPHVDLLFQLSWWWLGVYSGALDVGWGRNAMTRIGKQ
jgi:hypothetical protein